MDRSEAEDVATILVLLVLGAGQLVVWTYRWLRGQPWPNPRGS